MRHFEDQDEQTLDIRDKGLLSEPEFNNLLFDAWQKGIRYIKCQMTPAQKKALLSWNKWGNNFTESKGELTYRSDFGDIECVI